MSQTVREVASRLAAAGHPQAQAEARLLVAHALGVEVNQLVTAGPPTPEQAITVVGLLERRLEGVPVQHLLGRTWFRTVELLVGPGVFIPRPETELLVGWALDRLIDVATPLVVDLGTGSGAIAKAFWTEHPGSRVVAVELSEEARVWAERNFEGTDIELRAADLADACPDLSGEVDAVLSNPPYVPTRLRDQLPAEVLDHDPEMAVFSGDDGLDALRAVSRTARRLLRPGGFLVVEHDDSHGAEVVALLEADGWRDVEQHVDLTGRDRHVSAWQDDSRD